LLPFVIIAVIVIALIIVILGISAGMQMHNTLTSPIPNSTSNIQTSTNAIGEAQDKVDVLKTIVSFFEKLFSFIK